MKLLETEAELYPKNKFEKDPDYEEGLTLLSLDDSESSRSVREENFESAEEITDYLKDLNLHSFQKYEGDHPFRDSETIVNSIDVDYSLEGLEEDLRCFDQAASDLELNTEYTLGMPIRVQDKEDGLEINPQEVEIHVDLEGLGKITYSLDNSEPDFEFYQFNDEVIEVEEEPSNDMFSRRSLRKNIAQEIRSGNDVSVEYPDQSFGEDAYSIREVEKDEKIEELADKMRVQGMEVQINTMGMESTPWNPVYNIEDDKDKFEEDKEVSARR